MDLADELSSALMEPLRSILFFQFAVVQIIRASPMSARAVPRAP
jgi:hypothetical protein